MTLQELNKHIEKRIAELKAKQGIANHEVHVDVIYMYVINELEHLHDLSSVIPSKTSQPNRFKDENSNL